MNCGELMGEMLVLKAGDFGSVLLAPAQRLEARLKLRSFGASKCDRLEERLPVAVMVARHCLHRAVWGGEGMTTQQHGGAQTSRRAKPQPAVPRPSAGAPKPSREVGKLVQPTPGCVGFWACFSFLICF